MAVIDAAHDEEPRLVVGPRRRFDQRFVQPKRLRLDKVDSVLDLIGGAFFGIELEIHVGILI